MRNEIIRVRLAEILRPLSRPETVNPDKIYNALGARWYAGGLYIKESKPGAQFQASKLYRVEKGDFVYNRLFAWKGSFAVATEANHGCYVSNEFPCFAINQERADGQYLRWYFSISSVWDEALSLSSGGTAISRNRLKKEKFLGLSIPLPPLEEQRRIVARIEELAAKVEEARGLRRETLSEVDSVAGAAAVQRLKTLDGAPIYPIEEIAEVRGGIQKVPHRSPGSNPIRYLTVAHVHRNRILLSDPRFFEVSSEELERWRLEAGDVLIIEGNGSADQIGRTALFRGEIENCVHQNHVIRIRPNRELIDPEFLNLYLNSPLGQDEVQSRSRTTSGLRTLSVGRIKQIAVPTPSIEEQRRIVVFLDNLQAKVDALKTLQAETAAELDALLPSILDRAFKGEL